MRRAKYTVVQRVSVVFASFTEVGLGSHENPSPASL